MFIKRTKTYEKTNLSSLKYNFEYSKIHDESTPKPISPKYFKIRTLKTLQNTLLLTSKHNLG